MRRARSRRARSRRARLRADAPLLPPPAPRRPPSRPPPSAARRARRDAATGRAANAAGGADAATAAADDDDRMASSPSPCSAATPSSSSSSSSSSSAAAATTTTRRAPPPPRFCSSARRALALASLGGSPTLAPPPARALATSCSVSCVGLARPRLRAFLLAHPQLAHARVRRPRQHAARVARLLARPERLVLERGDLLARRHAPVHRVEHARRHVAHAPLDVEHVRAQPPLRRAHVRQVAQRALLRLAPRHRRPHLRELGRGRESARSPRRPARARRGPAWRATPPRCA